MAVKAKFDAHELFTNADYIFSVGRTLSNLIHLLYEESGGIPTVFVGVPNPIEAGLIKSLERPGKFMTGVIHTSEEWISYVKKISILKQVAPAILIPFAKEETSEVIVNDIKKLHQELSAAGFNVTSVPVTSREDAMEAIAQKINDFDILFIPSTSGISSFVPYLTYIALAQRKLTITFDGNSGILEGSAITGGSGHTSLVSPAVEQIRTLWREQKNIASLPIKIVNIKTQFIVNTFIIAQWILDGFELYDGTIINPRMEALIQFLEQENVTAAYRWPNCPLPPQTRTGKDDL